MVTAIVRLAENAGLDPALSTAIATLLGTLSSSLLIIIGFYFGPTARTNRAAAKETERLEKELAGLRSQIDINRLKAVVQEQEKDTLPENQTVPPVLHIDDKESTA